MRSTPPLTFALFGGLLLSACGSSLVTIRVPATLPNNDDDPLATVPLPVACATVDAQGTTTSCAEATDGWTVAAPLDQGETLTLTPLCQPTMAFHLERRSASVAVSPDEREAHLTVPHPPGRRGVDARLTETVTLEPLGADAGTSSVRFGAGTLVVILRTWPDATGACSLVAVRVPSRAGLVADGHDEPETLRLVSGHYFLVPASAVQELSQEDIAAMQAAERERQAAARRAEHDREVQAAQDARDAQERQVEAVATAEIASGQCSAESSRIIDAADQYLDSMMRSSHMIPRAHDRGVGGGREEPTFQGYAALSGRYHVLVGSWRPVTLDVVRDGSTVTTTSPYVRLLAGHGWQVASASFSGDAGERFEVRPHTRGCFALYVFYELPH
jgi:hypothetical protein